MVDRYNNGRGMRRLSTNNNSNNCGCKNNCSVSGNCKQLLHDLQKIDFSMIDVILYLDAYPCNREALDYYAKLKCERNAVVEALSKSCDMPITSFDNMNAEEWVWTDGSWPWELCAN